MEQLSKPTMLAANISKETADKVEVWCKEAIDAMDKHNFTLPEKAYALKMLVEGFEDAVSRMSKQEKTLQ